VLSRAARFFFLNGYLDAPVPDNFYFQPRDRFRLLCLDEFRTLQPPPLSDDGEEGEATSKSGVKSRRNNSADLL